MKKLLVTLGVAALVLPAAAKADSEFSIVLQGGAAKYNQSLSGSDVGAAYGARLGIMPTPMLGVEVGYLGSQNNINESLNQGRLASTLKTNEGYGDVRLNILPGEVTPYIFGGYGYTWSTAPRPPASGTAPPIHCPSAVGWKRTSERSSWAAGSSTITCSATSTPAATPSPSTRAAIPTSGRQRSISEHRSAEGFLRGHHPKWCPLFLKRQPHETRRIDSPVRDHGHP